MTSRPTTDSRWRRAAAASVVLLAAACSQQTAAGSEEAVVIPSFADDQRDASETSPPPVATTPPAAAVDETQDPEPAATEPADGAPTEAASEPDPDEADPDDSGISAGGTALGCTDATDLRIWLAGTQPEIANTVAVMPMEVWLCPFTAEVVLQLDCYDQETVDVLDALSKNLGDAVEETVSQIEASNTLFCASGDAIQLGLDALADRARGE